MAEAVFLCLAKLLLEFCELAVLALRLHLGFDQLFARFLCFFHQLLLSSLEFQFLRLELLLGSLQILQQPLILEVQRVYYRLQRRPLQFGVLHILTLQRFCIFSKCQLLLQLFDFASRLIQLVVHLYPFDVLLPQFHTSSEVGVIHRKVIPRFYSPVQRVGLDLKLQLMVCLKACYQDHLSFVADDFLG